MKYRTRDGLPFRGGTPATAAHALRRLSRDPGASLGEWMAETAEAAKMQTGHTVRSTTAREFLADLETAGLIRRLP